MKLKLLVVGLAGLFLCTASFGVSLSLGVSGQGAVNDSTVIAGVPFSVDIYFANDSIQRGFTVGFKVTSNDIKSITHVVDSGKGINPRGDVKGYNGWQDKSIWDLQGLFVVETNWEGKLPDTIGLGGVCVKQEYKPHDKMKCLSFDIVAPTTGNLVVDSSFFPPSGIWIFAGESQTSHTPKWGGPLKLKVVAKDSVKAAKPPDTPKAGNK